MKRLLRAIFHHWQIKLTCLAAAIVIWLFIKHTIARTERPVMAPRSLRLVQ